MRKSKRPRSVASRFYFLSVALTALAAGVLSLLRPHPALAINALVLAVYALHVAALREAVRITRRELLHHSEGECPAEPRARGSRAGGRAAARTARSVGRERAGEGRLAVSSGADDTSPAARRAAQARAWWRQEVSHSRE